MATQRPDIEAIKGRAEEAAMLGVMAYESDVIALLAYVAELEQIAAKVATIDLADIVICPFCDAEAYQDPHADDCPVSIARQLLGIQP